MKTLTFLFVLTIAGYTSCAQNQKCMAFSQAIINNLKGKIICQAVCYDDIYSVKADFPSSYELETIKTICDTTAKTTKVSYNWKINEDKNYEKEFLISGKKLLVTIYFRDTFMYFEFPKE